jgi:hypothetical protein
MKKNRKKVIYVLLCILILIITLYFVGINTDRTRIHNGNMIIEKIDLYKSANGFLPNSLQDMGQDEMSCPEIG